MSEPICKHFKPMQNSKACKHYHATKTNKVGLCMLKMKLNFFCLYTEKALGIYTGDTPIIKESNLWPNQITEIYQKDA